MKIACIIALIFYGFLSYISEDHYHIILGIGMILIWYLDDILEELKEIRKTLNNFSTKKGI